MKIQVNSDKTIDVDASLTRLVEEEVSRVLERFAKRLTRAEVHLSDVDNKKTGKADKRCLLEVRPTGDRPMTASAMATTTESAVGEAARKMQRSLTTFFGRKGRAVGEVPPASKAKKVATKKYSPGTDEKVTGKKRAKKTIAKKKVAAKKTAKVSARSPKKKGIYQARRKSWPSR
jgi:Sigma 54 modulation protein / S30EA ribosomal protein